MRILKPAINHDGTKDADCKRINDIDASLMRIQPVALIKLAKLRTYKAELLLLELFGQFVWKDRVVVPIGKEKNSPHS